MTKSDKKLAEDWGLTCRNPITGYSTKYTYKRNNAAGWYYWDGKPVKDYKDEMD